MRIKHIAMAVALTASVIAGCAIKTDKEKNKELVAKIGGMSAIPASVDVVLGVDVRQLAGSPVVERAVGQMFLRDPQLRQQVDRLIIDCDFDPSIDLWNFVIGMGAAPEDVVMAATGNFAEVSITACVGKSMSQGGGRLISKEIGGRMAYFADGGPGKSGVWFSFGTDNTIILASTEEWLRLSLGKTGKVSDNDRLAALISRADPARAIWAAGKVAPAIGQGLAETTGGKVQAPVAMWGHLDLKDGLAAELGAEMVTAEDAKTAVSFAKTQMATITLMFQEEKIGRLVRKVTVDSDAKSVYLRVRLTESELAQVLSKIDSKGSSEENREPDQGVDRDAQGDPPAGDEAPVR